MGDITSGDWYKEAYQYEAAGLARPLRIYSDDPGPGLPFTVAFVEGYAGIDGDVGDANARFITAVPQMRDVLNALLYATAVNDGNLVRYIRETAIPLAVKAFRKAHGIEMGRPVVQTDPPQERNAKSRISWFGHLIKCIRCYFTVA